jgi:hypothetical protein
VPSGSLVRTPSSRLLLNFRTLARKVRIEDIISNVLEPRSWITSVWPTILELSDWSDPLGALAIWLDCFNLDQKAIRYVR